MFRVAPLRLSIWGLPGFFARLPSSVLFFLLPDPRWLDAATPRPQKHQAKEKNEQKRTSSRPPAQCGIGRGRMSSLVHPRRCFYYTCRRKPGTHLVGWGEK
ncbi:hypothetical protein B0T16DRAFT_134717 [Cercophora newfieldiana]|uniref:Uncharacterized protein n=1 Tax=Cercophora newfieldiana TaxID=92897 RepID=A0AA39YBR7_9PEZI|nr:hypothetical protein B0T16DRAFT_134717 [Cercophora newfieldiana]